MVHLQDLDVDNIIYVSIHSLIVLYFPEKLSKINFISQTLLGKKNNISIDIQSGFFYNLSIFKS